MRTIMNWRGDPIEVTSSKGGKLAVINPFDNLVTTGVSLWPAPEIVQKLSRSGHIQHFGGQNREEVISTLGYHSYLQSINSEDAINWSFFGTLAYADQSAKREFIEALFDLLKIRCKITNRDVSIWLWRRVPHPDTLGSKGPEIDFGIQTERAVVFGEAKWLSRIDQAQGKTRDKDQITLRREFFEKYGRTIFGAVSHYVVLTISPGGCLLKEEDLDLGHAILHLRDITWEVVSNLKGHPQSTEIQDYLKWKKQNSETG